jgi:hypothetical protein
MKTRTAYRILRFANAGHLRQTYGADFYVRFKQVAEDKLRELLPKLPDLGDSVASTSYAFITAYVPFFHAFRQFDSGPCWAASRPRRRWSGPCGRPSAAASRASRIRWTGA